MICWTHLVCRGEPRLREWELPTTCVPGRNTTRPGRHQTQCRPGPAGRRTATPGAPSAFYQFILKAEGALGEISSYCWLSPAYTVTVIVTVTLRCAGGQGGSRKQAGSWTGLDWFPLFKYSPRSATSSTTTDLQSRDSYFLHLYHYILLEFSFSFLQHLRGGCK